GVSKGEIGSPSVAFWSRNARLAFRTVPCFVVAMVMSPLTGLRAPLPFLEIDVSDNNQAASQTLPPHVQLIQLGTAYWASRVVYAAAKLGLADQLAAGPKSAAELAGPMRVHAPSLYRLMRTLARLGLLTERPGQRFTLTTLGEALKTGA